MKTRFFPIFPPPGEKSEKMHVFIEIHNFADFAEFCENSAKCEKLFQHLNLNFKIVTLEKILPRLFPGV
jgi:hypothetical protein